MIIHNKICVIDFETDSLAPELNQPISIGAVMLDSRRLTVCDGGTFYSLINRIPDENVHEYGLNPLEKTALEKNKIKIEDVQKSPSLEKVWSDFINWFMYFCPKTDPWSLPIAAGHNHKYDRTILDRIMFGHHRGKIILPEKLLAKTKLSKMSDSDRLNYYSSIKPLKEPWGFGPQKLFHPSITLDTLQISFGWFDNTREPTSLSLDNLKAHFGFKDENGVYSHNALVDSLWSAEILVRYIALQRKLYHEVNFSTNGETLIPISKIVGVNKNLEEAPF
jgi:DNA polymerase III epsilon subunit-like protein